MIDSAEGDFPPIFLEQKFRRKGLLDFAVINPPEITDIGSL